MRVSDPCRSHRCRLFLVNQQFVDDEFERRIKRTEKWVVNKVTSNINEKDGWKIN